jgi:hypothetical protein
VSTAQHVSASHSLAISFNQPGTVDYTTAVYAVQVSLCGNGSGVDIGGKTLQMHLFVDVSNVSIGGTANSSPIYQCGVTADTFNSPTSTSPTSWSLNPQMEIVDFGKWISMNTDPFPNDGSARSVTNIGFEVAFAFAATDAPFTGTIYFDDISIQ